MYRPVSLALARHDLFGLSWKSIEPKASVGLVLVWSATDHSPAYCVSSACVMLRVLCGNVECSPMSLPQQHLERPKELCQVFKATAQKP